MTDESRYYRRAEVGQGLVEYALIILLVALVVILALGAFGTTVSGMFTTVVGKF